MNGSPSPPLAATPAQLRAIAARGHDLCVSAGAGSGKTFVLVERFVGLVRDGLGPDEILTITFTEKAAQEMTERIARALRREGLGAGNGAGRVEGAWISTIHGFCARLLRERALEAGVDPGFGVLTDVPAARLRRAAFLEAQRDLGTKMVPRYVRIAESLPSTETNKILKRVLRDERWECGDPVWLRDGAAYRPLEAADRKRIDETFAARGRTNVLGR